MCLSVNCSLSAQPDRRARDGTHVMSTNVQRSATTFDWGSIEWLVSADLMEGAELTFGYVEIEPGCANPLHSHPNCDEALFVIDGVLDHMIGNDVVRMTPGSAIHIPRGVPHCARSFGPQTARLVVAFSTGNRETTMLATPEGALGGRMAKLGE